MTIDDTLAHPASGGGNGAPIWSAATLPWRLTEIAAAGALAGVLMVLFWLTPRADLAIAATHPFFWIKATYPAAVAACALAAATGLARGRQGAVAMLAAAAVLGCAMLVAAAIQASALAPAGLETLFWPGGVACLGEVLVIAAPMLALTVAGLRDVDLPRPGLTGLACGLFSGGVAATVDGLHGGQGSYAFVGPWFTLALLVCGGLGAGAIKLLARRRRFLAAE